MTLRAMAVAAGLALAPGVAAAQDLGSVEAQVGGTDQSFLIREEVGGEASGVFPTDEAGERVVSLVATPVDPSVGEEEEEPATERLHVVFGIEGEGSDVLSGDPRIAYWDAQGRGFVMREGLSGVVTVSSLTEIGETLILGGSFSAELVPEAGGDEILGLAGDFQMTIEGE